MLGPRRSGRGWPARCRRLTGSPISGCAHGQCPDADAGERMALATSVPGACWEERDMERPDWAPEGIDIERPSAARIYDYWLGGSHNFASDREVARQIVNIVPDTVLIMQANRAFLHRAVRYLVNAGIRQFLDIGSGIPTLGNVHEVAQKLAP